MERLVRKLKEDKAYFQKAEGYTVLGVSLELVRFLEKGYLDKNSSEKLKYLTQKCRSESDVKLLNLVKTIDNFLVYLFNVNQLKISLDDSHLDYRVKKFRVYVKDVLELKIDTKATIIAQTLMFTFLSNSIINAYTKQLKPFEVVRRGAIQGSLSDCIFRKLYVKDKLLMKLNPNGLYKLSIFMTTNELSKLLTNEDNKLLLNELIDLSEAIDIYPKFISFNHSKLNVYANVKESSMRATYGLSVSNILSLDTMDNLNLEKRKRFGRILGQGNFGFKGDYLKASVVSESMQVENDVSGSLILLDSDNILYGIGNNKTGVLGTGTLDPSNSLVKIDEDVKDFIITDGSLLYLKEDGNLWTTGITNISDILRDLSMKVGIEVQDADPYIDLITMYNRLIHKADQSRNVLILSTLEYIWSRLKPTFIVKDVEKLVFHNRYPHIVTKSLKILQVETGLRFPRDTITPVGYARFIVEQSSPRLISAELDVEKIQNVVENAYNYMLPNSIDNYEIDYDGGSHFLNYFKDGQEIIDDFSTYDYDYSPEFKNNYINYSDQILHIFFNRNKDLVLHYIEGRLYAEDPDEFILAEKVEKYFLTDDMSIWLALSSDGNLSKITVCEDINGKIIITKKILDNNISNFYVDGYFACYRHERTIKVINLISNIGARFEERFDKISKKYTTLGEELVLKTRRCCEIIIKL